METLPKWLGDIIEEIEGKRYEDTLDYFATKAAHEAAEIAKHAAFVEAYSKVYRETFEQKFTLAIADREGRVVTDYDYNNIVDGDATKTVHIFATEAEADAFSETLNDREVKRREEARLLRQREEDGPLADIYELTGVKRRPKD